MSFGACPDYTRSVWVKRAMKQRALGAPRAKNGALFHSYKAVQIRRNPRA